MGMSKDPIIKEAIALAGSLSKLAAVCVSARTPNGITPQAVWKWKRIPAEHVLAIESLTGIRRERLRSDIFGAPRKRPRRSRTAISAAA